MVVVLSTSRTMQRPTSMKAGQKFWKWRDVSPRDRTDDLCLVNESKNLPILSGSG